MNLPEWPVAGGVSIIAVCGAAIIRSEDDDGVGDHPGLVKKPS